MDIQALYIITCSHQIGTSSHRKHYQTVYFILANNYFTVGNDIYLQIYGTATYMVLQYVNIFIADLEQNILNFSP